eukprot:COSAG02_NODE_3035_length_7502_cov_6.521680_3_plen_160_part_00
MRTNLALGCTRGGKFIYPIRTHSKPPQNRFIYLVPIVVRIWHLTVTYATRADRCAVVRRVAARVAARTRARARDHAVRWLVAAACRRAAHALGGGGQGTGAQTHLRRRGSSLSSARARSLRRLPLLAQVRATDRAYRARYAAATPAGTHCGGRECGVSS